MHFLLISFFKRHGNRHSHYTCIKLNYFEGFRGKNKTSYTFSLNLNDSQVSSLISSHFTWYSKSLIFKELNQWGSRPISGGSGTAPPI